MRAPLLGFSKGLVSPDPEDHVQFEPSDRSVVVTGFFNPQVGEETLGLDKPSIILDLGIACNSNFRGHTSGVV